MITILLNLILVSGAFGHSLTTQEVGREGARQTEFALLVDGVTSCVVLVRLAPCGSTVHDTSTDTSMLLQKAQRMENHNDHVKRLHSYL